MKVGIATFSWADNYGAVLQAFALQTYLEKLGYKVYIINYQPNRPTGILKQYFSKNPTGTLLKWENKYKRILFKRFRKKYFNLTPAVFESKEDLKKISNEFDLLVSGSDQVWNPKWLDQQEGLWDLCFLSFAGENTKVISYAASFGHKDLTTMKPKWQEEISAKLKKFVAISVREKSGINIVKSLTQNSNVFHVVDPTLLIDREYYINFISKTKIRKPYLLSYMLHGLDNESISLENKICFELKLSIIKCNANYSSIHNGYYLPSPIQWLGLINNASFVVTNSFHGVVFCLIFHVPFIALYIEGEMGSMNTRITDLLYEVGLENRAISLSQLGTDIQDFLSQTDWENVDKVINEMRMRADSYLKNNVN